MKRYFVNEEAARHAKERQTEASPWAARDAAVPDPVGFHQSMPGYRPTPLVSTPGLAELAGVASIVVKDQSRCFGLPAFKIIGASWAVDCARPSSPASLRRPTSRPCGNVRRLFVR